MAAAENESTPTATNSGRATASPVRFCRALPIPSNPPSTTRMTSLTPIFG